MVITRRSKVLILLLLVIAAGGASLLLEPVRLAGLALTGRSRHCSLAQAVDSLAHARRLKDTKDRILAASRLIETDASGFRHWQTPKGDFWIPPGEDWGLPFNLSEQENRIYGTGDNAVHAGDIVLDCGANVGVYVREALAEGAKLVVAIEPAPENLECLKRNVAGEVAAGRVIIYEKGVWDKDDVLVINVQAGNPAADSFVVAPKGSKPGLRLPLTTIDELVEELQLQRVDYIKMDVEGAERRALTGARKTLGRFHPRLALSTYHLPDDPDRLPALVREGWNGYREKCGPCTFDKGIFRPDVMYFR